MQSAWSSRESVGRAKRGERADHVAVRRRVCHGSALREATTFNCRAVGQASYISDASCCWHRAWACIVRALRALRSRGVAWPTWLGAVEASPKVSDRLHGDAGHGRDVPATAFTTCTRRKQQHQQPEQQQQQSSGGGSSSSSGGGSGSSGSSSNHTNYSSNALFTTRVQSTLRRRCARARWDSKPHTAALLLNAPLPAAETLAGCHAVTVRAHLDCLPRMTSKMESCRTCASRPAQQGHQT
jgi:hypothetical protein